MQHIQQNISRDFYRTLQRTGIQHLFLICNKNIVYAQPRMSRAERAKLFGHDFDR